MRRRLRSVFAAPARPLRAVLVGLVASGIVVVGPAASPASAAVPASFVFEGSGWGHGVGMSQYGARGQALDGRTADQILRHYYTGTALGSVDDVVDLRVNVLHGATTAAVKSESLAAGGGGIRITVGDAAHDAGPGDTFTFTVVAGADGASAVQVAKNGASLGSAPTVGVLWSGTPTVVRVATTAGGLSSSNRYRYGSIDVGVAAGKLEVVNTLKLQEEYLRGLGEMPSSWEMEALRAQAIAGRTYAMRKYLDNRSGRADCRCHVYNSVLDQAFVGYGKETAAGGDRWREAVASTAGQVVMLNGAVTGGYYFSSSGGRTQNNEDGFGGTPVSYLRSVDDPWSLDARVGNPNASWTATRAQGEVAAAFALPDVARIEINSRTDGGAVKTISAVSSEGSRVTITGASFRSRLGLKSTWLQKTVVRIAGADRYSTSVEIAKAAAPSATTVVIASGDGAHLVDGLVAAPLAAAKEAPLLLSAVEGLPAVVGDEVARRKATTAFLVGGESALGPGVVDGLRARGVTTVTRLAGADRYATGLEVARAMGGTRENAVIASGDAGHLVDALAAGGPAADQGWPVLLVSRDAVPEPTRTALSERGVKATTVVGGTSSVSDPTMSQLPGPNRLAGADRYATAVAVADAFSGPVGVDQVVVASGADANLVDALPGGALARVMLLTTPSPLSPATRAWLQARPDLGGVQVLGGVAAVSDSTFASIRAAVGG